MKSLLLAVIVFSSVILLAGHSDSGLQPVIKNFSVTVLPEETLAPMGFMLTQASPEGVKSGGTPVGVGTDFYGLPRDPEHPSMGAIQWHEPTSDYIALVKNILMRRTPTLTDSQRAQLDAKIDALFLKVYGYPKPK